ncbi:hypothetical protein Afil01_52080 [Actinorhabdospora filicis]|uniref:PPE family protein n=1 Tax=Actinorhabdospora filicis TaxID=1785913 RepID=A0A9W6SQH3_9ACTN|nr:hypothetical protein [Actinorhabdospora filicis]GLZ80401.1 hypothetical protein Afil01_52080 [Actinorhabdospora filicis]
MGDELVVTGDQPELTTGAGFLDTGVSFLLGIADDVRDGGDFDAANAIVGAGAVGIEVLDFAIDPLESIVSAGLGFLIEHIAPLRDGLDKVTGDPLAIKSLVTTWANIAKELGQATADTSKAVPGWTGKAAAAHAGSAAASGAAGSAVAGLAGGMANAVESAGVIVATIRSLVIDLIAWAITKIIEIAFPALALAVPTAGGSIAAAITAVIKIVADVLGRFGTLFKRLAEAVSAWSGKLKALTGKADEARSAVSRLDGGMRNPGARPAFDASEVTTWEALGRNPAYARSDEVVTWRALSPDARPEDIEVHGPLGPRPEPAAEPTIGERVLEVWDSGELTGAKDVVKSSADVGYSNRADKDDPED